MATAEELVEEAKMLIDEAKKRSLSLRTFGGVAIKYHCPSASVPPLLRKIADIDFFSLSKDAALIKKVFTDFAYVPSERFNALHGNKRLLFYEPHNNVRRDIFLDFFEMCHKFDFRKRLALGKFSIPLADLLMTKLQVVEIEERDYKDTVAILLDHELANLDDEETVNKEYIAYICSRDWGIYKTFSQNLQLILSYLEKSNLEKKQRKIVEDKIKQLLDAIKAKPKSLKWKIRSLIGEKMSWYDLPEAPKAIKFGE